MKLLPHTVTDSETQTETQKHGMKLLPHTVTDSEAQTETLTNRHS
jgi:hypothetical protein